MDGIIGFFFTIGFAIFIVVLYYAVQPNDKKIQKDKDRLMRDSLEYKKIFEKISDNSLLKIQKSLEQLLTLDDSQINLEVFKPIYALIDIKKEGGTKVKTDSKKIISDIDSFCRIVEALLIAEGKLMNEAKNKGLDFGIITNSAADMALYGFMDAREKKSNITTVNMQVYEETKKIVLMLKNDLTKDLLDI